MRWHTYKVEREPSFRLTLVDLTVLALIALLSWFGREVFVEHHLYLLPVYVGLSFFTFCNVFRIGNALEAFWYVPFVVLTLYGLTRPEIFWPLILGVCEPLRVALVVYRVRRGQYVGVFHERLARFGRSGGGVG